jgi:hypothetical protein
VIRSASALLAALALLLVAAAAQASTGQFQQAATLTNAAGADGDLTGWSVAISADGSTMVVGVPDADSRQGLAYVYTRGPDGWQTANQPAVLAASNGSADDEFGTSVAISQDGSVIAVGAPYAAGGGDGRGTIYAFNRPGGGWAAQTTTNEATSASGPTDFDRLGAAVAVSPDGAYVAAGATGYSPSITGQGGVFVWSYSGSALTTAGSSPLIASDGDNEDQLGASLAMPSDGLIYAGAPYHPGNDGPGAVYGFSSESSAEVGFTPWANVSQTELSAGGSSQFGSSVAADGGEVAVGAPATSSSQGAVYLFAPTFRCAAFLISNCFSSTSFGTPVATLTDPTGSGRLGNSVALTGSGQALLAGAPGEPAPPHAPPGSADVFLAPSGGWASTSARTATLKPADTGANDGFGTAVSLAADGSGIAIGDPSSTAATAGEADVFGPQTGVAVSCQPGTVNVGQSTRCTATVNDDGIAEATPTGDVGFSTDSPGGFAGNDSTCALAASGTGVASCEVSYAASAAGSGTHTISAGYFGDAEHQGGTGRTQVAINRVTTSTAVSCSPAHVAVGQATSCVVTVTAANVTDGPPSGTVSVSSNGPGAFDPQGCTLSGGSGTTAACTFDYTPSAVGPGTHQLAGSYLGDGGHTASQGTDPLGVAAANTSTSLSCSPLSVAVGKSTDCTVTVTDTSSGALVPSGAVTLSSTGSGTFGSGSGGVGAGCTLARASSGSATCTFRYAPATAAVASPHLSAQYGGDSVHFGSAASALLTVPATGTPTVGTAHPSLARGRIRVSLSCPKTEAYCRVTITVKAGTLTLAAGSVKIAGGKRVTLTLKPKAATLKRLRSGRHAITATVVAADQSHRSRRTRWSGYCVIGTGSTLKSLVVKK